MRQFAAILVDSFHESLDRKSLLVLLVLDALLIALCAGVSFETEKPESVLEKQCATLGVLARGPDFWAWLGGKVECQASDIRPVAKDDGWKPELAGGLAVTATFKTQGDVDRLVRRWRAFKARTEARGREPDHPHREPPPDNKPVAPEERVAFLEWRFQRLGYARTQARAVSDEPPAYRVAVRTEFPHELCAASEMKLLYGALKAPLVQISVAEMVVRIQLFTANTFAGSVGVLVAILVCSGFVPSMLQKGTLDLLLARPIGRGRLLLYKYVGGLWFVFLLAGVLIGGCWLAMTLRTGYANPWFLATVVTITATFAVIYSVAVLIGVLTRSATVAALVALFVWGTSGTIVAIRNGLKFLYMNQAVPAWVQNTLDVLYGLAPKTADLGSLNVYFLSRSHLSEAAYQRAFAGQLPKVDWLWSLGTTAAFTAVMLALAVWALKRRDY